MTTHNKTQQNKFGLIRLHFRNKHKALDASINATCYRGGNTWLALVPKAHANETYQEAVNRLGSLC